MGRRHAADVVKHMSDVHPLCLGCLQESGFFTPSLLGVSVLLCVVTVFDGRLQPVESCCVNLSLAYLGRFALIGFKRRLDFKLRFKRTFRFDFFPFS